METARICTESGPSLVECAATFGLWAATKHAGMTLVERDLCGNELRRRHRAMRGWTITHVPSGTSIGVRLSKKAAVALAQQLDERFPKLGAKWKPGQQTATARERKAVLALRDFIAECGHIIEYRPPGAAR